MTTETADAQQAPRPPQLAQGALGAWWWQGLRTFLMMRPQWPRWQASPGVVAVLLLTGTAAGLLIERLLIVGDAYFYWPALLGGWFPTAVAIWACWLLASSSESPRDSSPDTPPETPLGDPPPMRPARSTRPARLGAIALFALLCAQALPASLVSGLMLAPLTRADGFAESEAGRWMGGGVWVGLLLWVYLAQALVLWRSGVRRVRPRLAAMAVLTAAGALQLWMEPARHWYPQADDAAQSIEEGAGIKPFQLTQEDAEVQPLLLNQQLSAILPHQPGKAGLYAITFAPYADEDVFKRESELVASVMQQRFGAAGRTIQLVNHRQTLRQRPWATPLNLQRTIRQMARTMKRDEDVLFIHLTSHGASNGELAAAFEPLAVDPVTPRQLKRWLDEAGVRWRVISISACYSGSWIPELADANTLVMTAADADHTSYGCGKKSALTFFGRAMYDEQLREHRSFERGHAAARTVIERREREAGKDDGFSNPQIRVGEAIRARLSVLEQALAR